MQSRARVGADVGYVREQMPGDAIMSQLQYEANTTAGASTLTVSSILAGVINRSGPAAPYTDTLPTVAQLIAAAPHLSVGDSFTFLFRNTVAQAQTLAVGTGWTLGSNTAVAASLVREYLVTINSSKPTRTFSATTTNGSAVLSVVSDSDLQNLQPGMVLSGTGIAAGATIISINPAANTFTMSANATATGTNIGVTANPTATIEGVRSSTL